MESVNEAELDADKLAERDGLLKAIDDAAQRIQVSKFSALAFPFFLLFGKSSFSIFISFHQYSVCAYAPS